MDLGLMLSYSLIKKLPMSCTSKFENHGSQKNLTGQQEDGSADCGKKPKSFFANIRLLYQVFGEWFQLAFDCFYLWINPSR